MKKLWRYANCTFKTNRLNSYDPSYSISSAEYHFKHSFVLMCVNFHSWSKMFCLITNCHSIAYSRLSY